MIEKHVLGTFEKALCRRAVRSTTLLRHRFDKAHLLVCRNQVRPIVEAPAVGDSALIGAAPDLLSRANNHEPLFEHDATHDLHRHVAGCPPPTSARA